MLDTSKQLSSKARDLNGQQASQHVRADGPQITQSMRDQARSTAQAKGTYADSIGAQRRQQSVSEQYKGMER
jgi:hypothetical protein